MKDTDYSVKLDIFEGPMDLLTYLVRKNDLDVYNIPIAFITDEYLSYIRLMDAFDIDYAAEFLYMAATLAQIKSKMLLPVSADEDGDEEDDPSLAITRPLVEYIRLKEASELLEKRELLNRDAFTRPETIRPTGETEYHNIGIYELFETFKEISENTYDDHHIDFTVNRLSVKDRIDEIIILLEAENSLLFSDIIGENGERKNIILTFLALLEMLKLNLIEVRQHIQSGIIRVFYL